MNLKHFHNKKDFLGNAIALIEKVANNTTDICRIALSGGTTPEPLYKALSKIKTIDFSKIEFYQVDERYIPHDNNNSNYKLINETLIKPLGSKLKNFHYFDTTLTVKKCINDYLNKIKNIEFDLIILGMGTDGHIASLFPDNKKDLDNQNPAIHTVTKKFTIKDRLTISLKKIKESSVILLLLKGDDKKNVLDKLLNSKKSIYEMPVKGILNNSNLNIFLLT